MFEGMNSFALLAIPLFVLPGGLIERGKLGKALTDFVEYFVGKLPGGLGIVAVVSSAVFGAISGSAAATLSCIGGIMYPKLEEAHYNKGFAASLIANASPLGLVYNKTLFEQAGGGDDQRAAAARAVLQERREP